MSRTIVDVHILQTVPPSNLNRDDTGSPKTAVYGGARRSRVSSQAWKRATRVAFAQLLDRSELGVRTKRVVDLLAERIKTLAPELDERAAELAGETLKAVGILKASEKASEPAQEDMAQEDMAQEEEAPAKAKAVAESSYLVFFSARQVDNLAEAAVAAERADQEFAEALKAHDVKALANRDHSVDVALFGRMVTDVKDISVDAAAQVAHAISVHPVDNEFDYFTAVDDRKLDADEAGAAMLGTVEFNSATLYRYATVDVDRLRDNLGDPLAVRRALEAFVRAFATSMPTGKQNTFANHTLPDAIAVVLRDTQPISFVGAFEEPVIDDLTTGRVRTAADRLAEYAADVERAYGARPVRSWVVRVGDRTKALASLGEEVTMDELVTAVGSQAADRVADRP
jgi:CRISPR system Cascade subunit CasC